MNIKVFSYQKVGKSSKTVSEALVKFFNDQDKGYLSNNVLDFIRSKNVIYRRTDDDNHNALGIINILMRTLKNFFGEKRFVDEVVGVEFIYISLSFNWLLKLNLKPHDFKPVEKVKLFFWKNPFSKNLKNVSKIIHIIDSKSWKQFW